MNEESRRIHDFCKEWLTGRQNCEIIHVYQDNELSTDDLFSVIEQNNTMSDALAALEYAANNIASDGRRGVFIKAFVEGEDWAIKDLSAYKERKENE